LGAELLDRSVKPPRLNSLGSRVLEQARDLLRRTEALKSLASNRLEVRSALLQQQRGQLFERLAAEKISVSACDLREMTRDRRVHLGVAVADAERGRAAGAVQVPTTRRVVQIASLAAGDSWERIESPAEGAHCAYGGWGWRADGG